MVFRDTIAPLAGVQVDWAEVGRQQRSAAWFVGWLLLPLAALTLLARNGMPQYHGLILVGICVTVVALYLPFYLTRLLPAEKSRALWFGPLVILSGFVALAATYLGSMSPYVLSAMAAAVILPKITKSLFPVAEAGLAMIQGYAPEPSDCPQETALHGFGLPVTCGRKRWSRASACGRTTKALTRWPGSTACRSGTPSRWVARERRRSQ